VVGTNTVAYCAAGSNLCDEFISRVQVGTIDNASGCASTYDDYTAMSTDLVVGNCYSITVTNGFPYTGDQCGIWIDWNQDMCFDATEMLAGVSGQGGGGPYVGTIQAPATAALGPTRLRVRITYTGAVSPCGYPSYGEVEDYTVNVLAATADVVTIDPNPMYTYYQFAVPTRDVTIELGNLSGGHSVGDVSLPSIHVNGLAPSTVALINPACGFAGGAIRIVLPLPSFVIPYGVLYGTHAETFLVTGTFTDATVFSRTGDVTIIGKNPMAPSQYLVPNGEVVVGGDFDLSGITDISDVVAMIGYIFAGGPAPSYVLVGDADCSGNVDITDAVQIVSYIFNGGPAPCRYGSGE
jgi:hypothetical protein